MAKNSYNKLQKASASKITALELEPGKVQLGEHNSFLVKVVSTFAILLGVVLIILSQVLAHTLPTVWNQLILSIGIALAPSGVIGLISDYLVLGRTMERLIVQDHNLEIENKKLGDSIADLNVSTQQLQISTEFLKESSELGLVMIYPDRTAALNEFAHLMREQANWGGLDQAGGAPVEAEQPGDAAGKDSEGVDEVQDEEKKGRLIIVGSSMKGLWESIEGFDQIIANASRNQNCDFRIMLTHPHYCRYRENQEERPTGAIENEIFDSMLALEDSWDGLDEKKQKTIDKHVKLYKGTPTCFMIIAGDYMLINPYPYEKEAYKSFCLLVRRIVPGAESEEKPKSIYQQFKVNHFENPWKRNALPYQHFSLEGPIPIENADMKRQKRYGDIFVVQDSGKFHLIVVLSGDRSSIIRGVPPSIPLDVRKDEVKTIHLGNQLKVKLLPKTDNADCSTDCWEPAQKGKPESESVLKLDEDRRSGKYSCEREGYFINEIQMVGLFGEKPNPYKNAPFTTRKDLQGNPLPLFWYWVDNKELNIPPHPPLDEGEKLFAPEKQPA